MKKEGLALSLGFALILVLSMNLISGQTGTAYVNFSTGGMICERTSSTATWESANTSISLISSPGGNCSLYYIPGEVQSCCPLDQQCDFEEGDCYYWPVTRCDQYLDEETCDDDSDDAAEDSVADASVCDTRSSYFTYDGEKCLNYTSCECQWDDEEDECLADVSIDRQCRDPSGGSTSHGTAIGDCYYYVSIFENNCNTTGKIIVHSTARWDSIFARPDYCQNITRTYSCPATAQLDFGTNLTIAIIVIVLVAVYLYLILKRKK